MADDKSKVDARDRLRVAGGQDYEVRYFAEADGISEDKARELTGSMATIAKSLSRRQRK